MGDYYGANSTGYVIRNGVVYRDTVREDSSNGDLAIYKDGSFKIIYEDEISADQLVKDGVVNLLAFGPSLVENGEITVDTNSEVGQSMASNPRTAIGIIDETTTLSSCQTDGLQKVKGYLSTNSRSDEVLWR